MTTADLPTTSAAPSSFEGLFRTICDNVRQVVRGKDHAVELAVLCLIAEGHLLIEDVPGVGKTSLGKALAISIDGTFGRVQFTPDLLPADVVGTSIWNQQTGEFEYRPGPVFSNLLLADEINRATPKTQSALLEAMAERQVTAGGETRELPRPFMVIATQNPAGHHGTYPLPESQLDRFLIKVSLGYPSTEDEDAMLIAEGSIPSLERLRPVLSIDHVSAMARRAAAVVVSGDVRRYIVAIAQATRHHPLLSLGMSPRASLGLQRAAQVRAATHGRDFVLPDDVKAIALPVLAHRVELSPTARMSDHRAEAILAELIASVPIPNDGR
ncbi:MAG: MoxR family ATPase [Actinobacteria bacterium]|nr:MoxR family ATPase [Actinomycetota bacterium]